MDIDNEKLAALFYRQLQKTFEIRGQWRTCSDAFQRIWEEAIHEALVQAASQEGDENGAATLLLKRLSTATGDRATDFYTVAGLVFEELIDRHESGVSFLGLGNPWESRTQKTHEIWAVAIRRALARTALSGENPEGQGYCLFIPRESADRRAESTASPASAQAVEPDMEPKPKRPWWKLW